ncbi:MAG: hypothetical protein IPJ98_26770 [Bryobacterales bacterium]|nr:hypothetical protein [Bryobacterales bacterium]
MDRRNLLLTSLPGAGMTALLAAPGAQAAQPAPAAGVFNVRDYRAQGDGKTLDTAAIQAAIDACAAQGGGVVFFPQGRFLSGTVELKSSVTLYLSPRGVLLGSPNPGDYKAKPFPARDLDVGGYEIWALVYAEGASHVGIAGPGTIDANGGPLPPVKHAPDVAGSVRPRALFLKNCRHVTLRDVAVRESAMWSVHLARCEKILVHGISVFSSLFVNQDGLVLDSCQDAMVSDCYFDTYDDALVLKTSFPQPCRNIAITNCVLTTRCAAIKFGTQSLGAFRNITISNCSCSHCGLGGLKFFTVDGGDLEDITVSNISMSHVSAPIFFRLGNRGFDLGFQDVERPRPVARLRNVVVSGVRASVHGVMAWPNRGIPFRAGATMGIVGLPGHPVEGVLLDDIHVTFEGGGTLEEAHRTDIPERPNAYPENTMFGVLPAYGLYLRHAKGITLSNIRFAFNQPDLRPAMMAEDVDDLEINGLQAAASGSEPLLRLVETRGALIRASRPLNPVDSFLRVEGQASRDIALLGNDLRLARHAVLSPQGSASPVIEEGNLRPGAARTQP